MEYVIGIILFLIAFIIYGLILRKRVYDQVDQLEAWKMDIMNQNVTEELSKVKNLNLSGETQEKFEAWREQWDDILTKQLPDIEEHLFDAEEAADRYRFPTAKKVLRKVKDTLTSIEGVIQGMFQELDNLLHSEENSRNEFELIKPKVKEVRKQLLQKRYQFGKAEVRFEIELDEIEEKMHSFESMIASGNYFEAQEIIRTMKEALFKLSKKMEVFPLLYKKSKQEIPSILDDLLSGLREMKEDGYRIEQFGFEKQIHNYQERLVLFVESLDKGEIAEIEEGITEIEEAIKEMYTTLEHEAVARHFVQSNIPQLKEQINSAETLIRNTKKEVNALQESYHFEPKDLETNQSLEKWLNQLKKQADEVVENSEDNKKAYSQIKLDMENWEKEWQELKSKHDEFQNRLHALRKDERASKEKIKQMKQEIMDTNRLLRKSNLPGIPTYLLEAIDEAAVSIEQVSFELEKQPLDMSMVQNTLKQAEKTVNTATDQTNLLLEQATLAEHVIQYANRYRSHYPLIGAKLIEAEQAFRNYEYEEALEITTDALGKVEPGAIERIQGLLKTPM